jgi:putative nucleotidyltransferase with HDIG domain
MDSLQLALLVIGGWIGVSVLAYLLVLPMLRASRNGDALGQRPRGLAQPSSAGVPSPQRLGYSGVVLERLVHHARTVLGVHRAWLTISPPGSTKGFTAVAAAGTDPDVIGRRFDDACASELGAVAHAPVVAGRHATGALCVAAPVDGRSLGRQDQDLLRELGELAREALSHHAHRELVAGDSRAEIRALVMALAEVDGDTYHHSLEVAATAREVAKRLGLAGPDLVEVELAALLHDIGKLHLPAEVLTKPGPLNAEERQLMKMHPEWGAEMVARVPGLEAVALIVRTHHERLDGAGYPHQLPAERIPMASRIVAACDAYGAMTRRRNYSEPLDVRGALDELERNVGTQFDPLVVEVLTEFVCEPVEIEAVVAA